MFLRMRAGLVAAASVLVFLAVSSAPASANPLSLLFTGCAGQSESQVFAPWGDLAEYTPAPGGNFEPGGAAWALTGGAQVVSGNETFNVAGGSHSLSLPAGSTATSPRQCTSISHPSVRFFVRNTGAPTSQLRVQALYPGLLGGTSVDSLGTITASSQWSPSPANMSVLAANLLATLSLDSTTIAFRFIPVDSTGNWSIDDVYLDPYGKA